MPATLDQHRDDSYGACVICREYVPHTEDDFVTVAWPCAVVRLAAERARIRAAVEGLAVCKSSEVDTERDTGVHDHVDGHCGFRAAVLAILDAEDTE